MSEDRVNQPKWNIQGSRVYGDGQSFNCTNRITAEQLHNTLCNYEKDFKLTQNTTEQFDKITKQVIQIQLTLGILDEDIKKLKGVIENVSKD